MMTRYPISRRACLILLAGSLLILTAGDLWAREFKLTLAGASPGGLWSLLGEGINGAIAKAFPGSSVTYQTTGGGLANISLVSQGKAEMGLAHNVEVKTALLGEAPYQKPVEGMQALAYVYNWAPMQFIVRKDFAEKHGITSLRDIAEKKPPLRVAVNQRGNMVEAMNRKIFAACGFDYADIEAWGGQVVFAGSQEMANLVRDRRIDMFGNGVFAPHSSILEAANAVPVEMLSIPEEVIERVSRETGADPYVIPAGAYEWLAADVPTVALGAMVLIRQDLPDESVYQLTRALVEDVDVIRSVHKSMKTLTPRLMASQRVIPYHPGAARYYRESGLLP